MWDFIFGGSKPKQEKKSHPQQTLSAQDAWAYDFIRQYLVSPLWRNPMMDFIEENCLVFEDSEENKFAYTKVFKDFVGLCQILLESILSDTGISLKILQLSIMKGLSSKKDHKIFQQLLLCDNFEAFKRIMITKNKEMQIQALKQIGGSSDSSIRLDEKELERLEIQKAIAMSLAIEEKLKVKEDEEFQEAIRISQKESQIKEEKEEKKESKSLLGDLPPLMVRQNKGNKTIQQFKQEETKVIKEIETLKINEKKKEQEEGSEDRKKRLVEQRELIKKKKMEERQKQLDAFVTNKPAQGTTPQKVGEQELERRKKLMQKLKDQLKD